MIVQILRGLPGSGKSTYASQKKDAFICSADQYHIDSITGKYNFDIKNIGKAHQSCLKQFVLFCTDKYIYECLIVDNTNTTAIEMAPYIRIAQAFGFKIEILNFDIDIETSYERNVHNVPSKTIQRMDINLKSSLPKEWRKFQKDA